MLRNTTIYVPRGLYEEVGEACISGILRRFLRSEEAGTILNAAIEGDPACIAIKSGNNRVRYHLKTDIRTLNSLKLLSAKMNLTISDVASIIIYLSLHERSVDGFTMSKMLCDRFGEEYEEAGLEMASTFIGEYDRFNLTLIMRQIQEMKLGSTSCIDYMNKLIEFMSDKYGAHRLFSFVRSIMEP
ncbi:hypothetical protein GCM10007981_07210 [Thermocladium modestius]|uniref:Uncharacterized protein n=1 Tax=Thermocladium modestius TaxID=62609 RepID=A0A830GT61_9CREN|nr:hypothetical protein [Thermocladium modestius]GGP20179.1 hypothetical protein GCM10007981_07210 [Thermocladium modestius]